MREHGNSKIGHMVTLVTWLQVTLTLTAQTCFLFLVFLVDFAGVFGPNLLLQEENTVRFTNTYSMKICLMIYERVVNNSCQYEFETICG